MLLTPKQIEDLNKVVNRLPLDRLKRYASDGTITREVLAQLSNISPERHSQLLAVIEAIKPETEIGQPEAEQPKPEQPEQQKAEQPELQKAEQPKPTPPFVQPPHTPAPGQSRPPFRHASGTLEQELAKMHEEGYNYSAEQVFQLLEHGPLTRQNLFDEGLATPESLEILSERDDIIGSLPDINAEISKCRRECAADHTDVFLLGIPSTGKTSILMGLIGSPHININTVRAGGPYSCVLEQYLDAGLTIGQTPKDFVATIEAEIPDGKERHLLNLVEMAGEDFAFKIADNEQNIVSLEDIGTGATQLLSNSNRKVLFIIVDPTARRVAFNHLTQETDAEGNIRTYLVRRNVNQKIILKRLVDLLSQPENKRILRNVDNISIVITKADVLGQGQQREDMAYQRFMDQHQNIIRPLIELCRANGINRRTDGQPMLYTFSLGRFYVGGVYQYDPTDANKLVEVLRQSTSASRKGMFGSGFKAID